MTDKGKKILLVALAIVVPMGAVAAGIGWWRMRRKVLPWTMGLVGAGVGVEPIAYAAKLATKSGVGLHQYALARMMQSEGNNEENRIIRAQVAINDAKATTGGNVYRVLTLRRAYVGIDKGKRVEFPRGGFFGEQGAGGRYSTVKEPSAEVLALAGRVLRGEFPDKTKGATRFLDVRAFKSQKGVRRTFAEVDAKWKSEGFRPIQPTGSKDFLVYTRSA